MRILARSDATRSLRPRSVKDAFVLLGFTELEARRLATKPLLSGAGPLNILGDAVVLLDDNGWSLNAVRSEFTSRGYFRRWRWADR